MGSEWVGDTPRARIFTKSSKLYNRVSEMTDLNLLACCLLSLLTMGQELSTDRRANPDGSETTTTVTAEEMWQHFQGELPVLHKPPNPLNAAYPNDIRFDDRWTTDIPLLVVVSDKGDVVRADVQGDL